MLYSTRCRKRRSHRSSSCRAGSCRSNRPASCSKVTRSLIDDARHDRRDRTGRRAPHAASGVARDDPAGPRRAAGPRQPAHARGDDAAARPRRRPAADALADRRASGRSRRRCCPRSSSRPARGSPASRCCAAARPASPTCTSSRTRPPTAARDVGMRAHLGITVIDFPTAAGGDADDYLDRGPRDVRPAAPRAAAVVLVRAARAVHRQRPDVRAHRHADGPDRHADADPPARDRRRDPTRARRARHPADRAGSSASASSGRR